MYPHERSLVKRLADKPFALIGVNSDDDKKELKKRMAEERINWRSFYHKGVIRFKGLQDEELDTAVYQLLKELAEAGK
jgi:hypothetical protein